VTNPGKKVESSYLLTSLSSFFFRGAPCLTPHTPPGLCLCLPMCIYMRAISNKIRGGKKRRWVLVLVLNTRRNRSLAICRYVIVPSIADSASACAANTPPAPAAPASPPSPRSPSCLNSTLYPLLQHRHRRRARPLARRSCRGVERSSGLNGPHARWICSVRVQIRWVRPAAGLVVGGAEGGSLQLHGLDEGMRVEVGGGERELRKYGGRDGRRGREGGREEGGRTKEERRVSDEASLVVQLSLSHSLYSLALSLASPGYTRGAPVRCVYSCPCAWAAPRTAWASCP
jgi:hypothetical protein